MPMLLEDLAEETSAGNRRTADRLDAETRELEKLRRVSAVLEEQRERIVESARQATEYVLSRVPQTEGIWRSALATLRKEPTGEAAEQLLRRVLDVIESGQRLFRSPRAMWELARECGAASERFDELDRAEERFEELAAEARRALEHRTRGWQPSDPDRLASGLQRAHEGKTVNEADAVARFRGPQG